MVCNDQAVVLYSPMQVYTLNPRCGPSCGGTILSVIGTALKETNNLRVRFTYGVNGSITTEVEGRYIEQRYVDQRLNQDQPTLQSIYCATPNFEAIPHDNNGNEKETFPQKAKVLVSLDGMNYVECEQDFLIYPSDIKINNAHPKCGPVLGGTELVLMVDIDPMITDYLFNLCFGFQQRPNVTTNEEVKNDKPEDKTEEKKTNMPKRPSRPKMSKSVMYHKMATKLALAGSQGVPLVEPINPLVPNEEQIELENWHCVTASYTTGKITCSIPRLNKYNPENLQYNVDIALNGQQFSGYPIIFRYYGMIH